MGDELDLRERAEHDERATISRIEALQGQLASEQRHLAEVRLFKSMLSGYTDSSGAPLAQPRADAASAAPSDGLDEAGEGDDGMSAAQAEELERLNRLFGLSAGN